MKFNEIATIEKYIIKYLKDNLDYEYIPPAQFATLREFETEYLIKSHLLEAIKKINKIDDEQAKTILREIKKLDTNEEFLHLMRYGVNLKDPQTQKSRDYLVFDLTDLENNHFVVTNQFYFEGNSENIRTDVLVFVNGLPIVNIEAKSPTASTSILKMQLDKSNAMKELLQNYSGQTVLILRPMAITQYMVLPTLQNNIF